MAQFTAYVYQGDREYRVVVEGLGAAVARSLFEAEELARRLIEQQVRAAYPLRRAPAPSDALGAMNFDLEIVRADGTRERRELWLRAIPPRSRPLSDLNSPKAPFPGPDGTAAADND